MATKKIEPKQPAKAAKTAEKTDKTRETDRKASRKTASYSHGG